MGEPALRAMTADEFLAWDDGTDTRYELVAGVVVAMAPPTHVHGVIVGNAYAAVRAALVGRAPCHGLVEAGIRVDAINHFKADVAATCVEPAQSPFVEEPFLIVEVLSESTWREDIGPKLQRYIQMSSVREIWLIDSRERWVQVWRRTGEAWVVTLPLLGEAAFGSEALGCEIPLDAFYSGTGL